MGDRDRARLDSSLRRIDVLIEAIENVPHSSAREPARELIEIVLDLHGLALARIMAAIAVSEDRALSSKLADDPQIKAMLLLHGLHPEEIETRVRRAIERIRPHLGVQGVRVELTEVGPRAARIFAAAEGDSAQRRAWRREIEQALMEAAPDLEEIVIIGLDESPVGAMQALVG